MSFTLQLYQVKLNESLSSTKLNQMHQYYVSTHLSAQTNKVLNKQQNEMKS